MRRLLALFKLFGIDFARMASAVQDLPRFFVTRRRYRTIVSSSHALFPSGKTVPCLGDHKAENGCGRGAYFCQDLWVAQQIFRQAPERHVDVGSRVDGFVAHVAAFRELEVIDIRPLYDPIPNVSFKQADMMGALPEALVGCCDSLSCLHALEHFGLGRYGDPIDPDGWKKGFDNLCALLKPGGRLYLSVPIGPSRVEFNSQRVFAVPVVLELLAGRFAMEGFAVIDDRGLLRANVDWEGEAALENCGCTCGCGIFVARKIA